MHASVGGLEEPEPELDVVDGGEVDEPNCDLRLRDSGSMD